MDQRDVEAVEAILPLVGVVALIILGFAVVGGIFGLSYDESMIIMYRWVPRVVFAGIALFLVISLGVWIVKTVRHKGGTDAG